MPGAPLVARNPQVPTSSPSCTPLFAKLLLLSHFPPRLLAVSQHPHGTFQPGPQPAPWSPPRQSSPPTRPGPFAPLVGSACSCRGFLPPQSCPSPCPSLSSAAVTSPQTSPDLLGCADLSGTLTSLDSVLAFFWALRHVLSFGNYRLLSFVSIFRV